MFSISNISIAFGGIPLFDDISFVINNGDRIGLVGKNGVGKSTLMKIISGAQAPDSGSIGYQQDQKIGYLAQEINITSSRTIYDEVISVFGEIISLEKDIENINRSLSEREDYESDEYADLITSLNEKYERLNLLGGNEIEGQTEKILTGLGFEQRDFGRKVSEFSGGWQMRVELAKLLLQKPDLLLLDEPTNHLDIESILWLEDFFRSYPGAIMLISHDRMFLDNVTNRTIEITFGRIYDYKVSYSKFLDLREERLEQQMNAYNNQQKQIAQQEAFINRFRAKATKARQVQSKIKQLEKMDRIEMDEIDTSSIHFRFPSASRSGKVVIRAEQLSKSYGDKTVFKDVDITVERGEKIAFVGRNGEGKTTLVKLIAENESHNGQLELGHNVELGYYAQLQENTLDENRTVYETIERIATNEWANMTRIRTLLGAFLFNEDDIDKKVKVLSGGEKSRLALARLLLKPSNLLILDEPTNHLDIQSKDILKNALREYDGTLILVSHDRDFLQGLTNKTFEFSNKKIKEHPGTIDDFLYARKSDSFREFELKGKSGTKTNSTTSTDTSPSKEDYQARKEKEKQLRKLKSSIKNFESEIEKLEKEIAELESQMQAPDFFKDQKKSQDIFAKHKKKGAILESTMKKWEDAVSSLEDVEN